MARYSGICYNKSNNLLSSIMTNEIVVLDTSVLAHAIHDGIMNSGVLDRRDSLASPGEGQLISFDTKLVESLVISQVGWLQSCAWLGELTGYMTPSVVWTFDVKDYQGCYWRNHYLRDFLIDYKAGRRSKSELFITIMRTIQNTIDRQGWMKLAKEGYEGDDFAGALVSRNRYLGSYNYLTLLTIDTDWLGLVGSDCRWLSSDVRWVPRVRHNLTRVNIWAKKRWGIELESPSDLWNYKADTGDASDKLPPGSPIGVIDLLNPTSEYNILNDPDICHQVDEILTNPKQFRAPDAIKCQKFMRRYGIAVCVPKFLQDS